jgi:hypothetical protein
MAQFKDASSSCKCVDYREKVTSADEEDSDAVVEEVTEAKCQKPFQEQHRQSRCELGALGEKGK